MAVYCASKAFVLSLSRAMSAELRGSGVTVTALCPGYVETGFQKVSDMRLTGVEIWSSLPVDKVAKIAVRAMKNGRREVIRFYQLVGTNLGKIAAHQHPTVDCKGFIDDEISHRWQLEQAYVDLRIEYILRLCLRNLD